MTSPTPATTALRRTGVASGLMVGTALGAHVAAGGDLPPASVLVVLVAALVGVGSVVAGGRVGRWASVTLVGVSQFVVHEALVVTAGWSATTGPGAHGGCAGADAHALMSCDGGAGAVDMAHSLAGPGPADLRMLLLHATATVVTGWLLGAGDRMVAAARAVVRPPVVLRPAPVPAVRHRAMPWVDAGPRVPVVSLVCVARRPRRGPPRVGRVTPPAPA
jgi:hypothetical protein